MLSRYHIEITKKSLENFFSPLSLREIARANVAQDSLPSMFGVEARRHVCNCTVLESLAYIDEEQTQIANFAQTPGSEAKQRAALGRLLHTVQDFYAHTNYVALWVVEHWDVESSASEKLGSESLQKGRAKFIAKDVARMDGLDPNILAHPSLQIAQWQTWRDPFYYVPLLGRALRHFWLPAVSHEAINLDSPSRGAHFDLAMAIARQRTLAEYARAVAAIGMVGGRAAVARFHGAVGYAPSVSPVEA